MTFWQFLTNIWTGLVDWLRNGTQLITEALRQVLLWAIGMGLVTHDFAGRPWDDTKTVLTISAASAVLAVIAAKTTVAATKHEHGKQAAFDKGVAHGTATAGSSRGLGGVSNGA